MRVGVDVKMRDRFRISVLAFLNLRDRSNVMVVKVRVKDTRGRESGIRERGRDDGKKMRLRLFQHAYDGDLAPRTQMRDVAIEENGRDERQRLLHNTTRRGRTRAISITPNLGNGQKETRTTHRDDLHGSPSLVPIQIPPLLSPFCGEPAPPPIDQPERDGRVEREIMVHPEKRQIEWREGHRERADLGWECTSRRASRSLAGCSSSY